MIDHVNLGSIKSKRLKLENTDFFGVELVVSDIHADISALEKILQVTTSKDFIERYGQFSRIINLGDVLERGTSPKQVLKKLQELSKSYDIKSVMGNHDEAFLYGKMVSGSTLESLDAHAKLTDNDLSFFPKNKDGSFGLQEFIDERKQLICVHGGPLDPDKLIPPKAGEEAWLYQKTWQRLSEEDFEFFSYAGYHYTASSAFNEARRRLGNFVILCGHQHQEAVLKQEENNNDNKISEVLSSIRTRNEKISGSYISKREILIEPSTNYFVRVGLGGPEGYYGIGKSRPHFAMVSDEKISLFDIM